MQDFVSGPPKEHLDDQSEIGEEQDWVYHPHISRIAADFGCDEDTILEIGNRLLRPPGDAVRHITEGMDGHASQRLLDKLAMLHTFYSLAIFADQPMPPIQMREGVKPRGTGNF